MGPRAPYATGAAGAVRSRGSNSRGGGPRGPKHGPSLTLRDLEGERLRNEVELDLWALPRDEEGIPVAQEDGPNGGTPMQTVSYEEETGP